MIHVQPESWGAWLHGREEDAVGLFRLPPTDFFDQGDVLRTDAVLAMNPESDQGSNLSLF